MEIQPYKNILQRCENIEGKTVNEIFVEAGVDPANIHNWKKKESIGLIRWHNLIGSVFSSYAAVLPGESTFKTMHKHFRSYKMAIDAFAKNDYSQALTKLWKHEDPQYIESFKRVLFTVRKYEE